VLRAITFPCVVLVQVCVRFEKSANTQRNIDLYPLEESLLIDMKGGDLARVRGITRSCAVNKAFSYNNKVFRLFVYLKHIFFLDQSQA
jgi:hypothetical protein